MGVTRYASTKIFEKCTGCENRNGHNCSLGGECTYRPKSKKHNCPLNSVKGECITNGEMMKATFPNIEVEYYINLSGMRSVSVMFNDSYCGYVYSIHTFSREWWDSEYKK